MLSFKSHRDKVQIFLCYPSTPLSSRFKSHRDKVQMQLSLVCLLRTMVSNPIGTKFKLFPIHLILEKVLFQIPQGQSSNLLSQSRAQTKERFKSHRDKVQIRIANPTNIGADSFKSHRDKVQIKIATFFAVIQASFKSHRDKVQMLSISNISNSRSFQIPQGQSSNLHVFSTSICCCTFQIPQGQSSNGEIEWTYEIKRVFQIPQGQSSN